MSATARWRWPHPGTCRVCGCTEAHACDGGCSWVDTERTVCSTCGGTEADMAYALAWIPRVIKRRLLYTTRMARVTRIAREAAKRWRDRQPTASEEHG